MIIFRLFLRLLDLITQIPPLSWLRRWLSEPRLINFHTSYGYIRLFRIVHIGGRYGGYKTLLAVLIGQRLWADGYVEAFYSNLNCVWNDDPDALIHIEDPRNARCVFVFDEAGQFFKRLGDVDEAIAALRKIKVFMLLPSVRRPALAVAEMKIEPRFVLTAIGIPLIIYRTIKYGERASDDQTSYFGLWRPEGAFGIYDTDSFPVDGNGLDNVLVHLTRRISTTLDEHTERAQVGNAAKKPTYAFGQDNLANMEQVAGVLQDTSRRIAGSAADLKAEKKRGFLGRLFG